jgi:4-diphosphocytidyl-2-C-methyl-D-erythritol kinase
MVSAPAKINLHLAVGELRPDGFHSIASLFQAVSLADTVTLSPKPHGGISLSGDCACPPEENVAYRAASAFMMAAREAGRVSDFGLAIDIRKNIPIGAGLGGGSSDAAATLLGLHSLFPRALERDERARIALEIGSDVPFFLGTPCAAVTGRGERLSVLPSRTDYVLVILDPGFPVSTKKAYALLDARRDGVPALAPQSEAMLEAELGRMSREYANKAPAEWSFYNDFYDALLPEYPELASCRAAILDEGAIFATMSGSGSAIIAVFSSLSDAQKAVNAISSRYLARIAFPLARLRDSI